VSTYDDTAAQQQKGPEAYLSQEERQQLQRFLKFPEEFPREFGAWLEDYISTNAVLQRSQVQGLNQFSGAYIAPTINTSQFTTSATYVDLGTVGPQLTGLADGTWLVTYGANIFNNGGTPSAGVYMNVQANDTAIANDDNAIATNLNASSGSAFQTRTIVMELANSNNNTLTAKYRADSGGACVVSKRQMFAQRIA
jgi:hypothetical protein